VNKVKVQVLRRGFYADIADAYLTEGRSVGPCPLLKEGDSFLFEGDAVMPKGFCPWAWIDIYQSVSALSAGATFAPWNSQEHMQVICCTDGVRPVTFLIETVTE